MSPLFPSLGDSAHLWIWVADRPLSESQQESVHAAIGGFLSEWTSHGRRVQGNASIFHDQVLVLAAEIPEAEISGCGIDKSVHLLEGAAQSQNFQWSSPLDVPLLDEEASGVSIVPRGIVRQRAARGEISADVRMVDRTLGSLGELRSGGLVRPARLTWAARYFRTGAAG